eukprot:g2816.t1
MQKSIRRGLDKETLFWTAELEQSGLGLLALARFGIIIPEDVGLGAPELAIDYCTMRKTYLSLLQDGDAVHEGEPLPPNSSRSQVLLAFARRLAAAPKCRMAHTAASAAPLLLSRALHTMQNTRRSGAVGEGGSDADEPAADVATALAMSTFESGEWALSRCSIVEALRLVKSLAQLARDAATAADVQVFEERAIIVLQRLFVERDQQYPGDSKWSREMWRAVLALKPQRSMLARSARALHAMCHGGGCAAMRYGLFMALQLFTREPWMAPRRPATTQLTSEDAHALLHRGLHHRMHVPTYAVDKHTVRGKGRRGQDNDSICWGTDTRNRLDVAVAGRGAEVQRVVDDWSEEEVTKSHGPGRVWLRTKLRPPQEAQAHAAAAVAAPAGTAMSIAAPAPQPPLAAVASSRVEHSLASQFWDEGMSVIAEFLPTGCACDPYFRAARECSLRAEAMHGPRGVSAAIVIAEQWAMVKKFRLQHQVVNASAVTTVAAQCATSTSTNGRPPRKTKSRKARHKRVQGTGWS